MKRAGRSAGCGVLTLMLACQPARRASSAADEAEYPFTLLLPESVPGDFMVRQSISVKVLGASRPEGGSLEAVVQKRGDSLLVLGLGPASVPVFQIELKGGVIRYERKLGPELPVSARTIVVDVERVYFARLPLPPDAPKDFSGRLEGTVHGEVVTEQWRGGTLTMRSFARPSRHSEPIVLTFDGGYTTTARDPRRVTLHNPWLGYDATITSDPSEPLD